MHRARGTVRCLTSNTTRGAAVCSLVLVLRNSYFKKAQCAGNPLGIFGRQVHAMDSAMGTKWLEALPGKVGTMSRTSKDPYIEVRNSMLGTEELNVH